MLIPLAHVASKWVVQKEAQDQKTAPDSEMESA